MNSPIIKIEGISKKYFIGQNLQGIGVRTLRDAIDGRLRSLLKRKNGKMNSEDSIWALRDISLEVQQGEVLGIIGRNGAGKSTLLKILSRITHPTVGQVTLKGRVASLLEVGTGFNMELTGRENVYLNGAILGMRRAEIRRKFDEIIDFAEVEKFLDTPVKRYSTGMYLRLAFAVAAHLEPEILIVDEVLAVGDASFQKKCLGKMKDVAQNEGRTVLFVSHNLQAITGLCQRAIRLDRGIMVQDADALTIVRDYALSSVSEEGEKSWKPPQIAPGDDTIRLTGLRLVNGQGTVTRSFLSGEPVRVQMEVQVQRLDSALAIGFDLCTTEGTVVMRCYHNDARPDLWPQIVLGRNVIECEIPPGILNAGTFTINPKIGLHCIRWIVNADSVLSFDVQLTHGVSPFWNVFGNNPRPGLLAMILKWNRIDSL